jgi:hypothetical protein
MPRPRPKLTQGQQLVKQAREGGPVQRIAPPRTTCERCGTEQYALPDGTPRQHLRPAIPGEELYSETLPDQG